MTFLVDVFFSLGNFPLHFVFYLLILSYFMQKDLEEGAESSLDKIKDGLDKDAISKRLEEIYKRLEYIDADAAEARAASILAVCFFTDLLTSSS
jgi:hypothetical protein